MPCKDGLRYFIEFVNRLCREFEKNLLILRECDSYALNPTTGLVFYLEQNSVTTNCFACFRNCIELFQKPAGKSIVIIAYKFEF